MKFGITLVLGTRSRRFKSCHSDSKVVDLTAFKKYDMIATVEKQSAYSCVGKDYII